MAENTRYQTQSAIKRASIKARRLGNKLDKNSLDELTAIYKTAVADLRDTIKSYEGSDGSVKLDVLNELLQQTDARLQQLTDARNQLLDNKMVEAASLGIQPFLAEAGTSLVITQVAHDAVQQIRNFVAADGLQLSDRIWRIDNHAKQVVTDAIQSAVIQGNSATQAALDFISTGQNVPRDIAAKMATATGDSISRAVSKGIFGDKGSPYDNALRLFRTEINRAHGNAYESQAFENPDVVGTRFLLSPGHPRHDICDMHANVNRYGLGNGVYPKDRNPWPAHPNTLSYVEVVFKDEVTAEDRAGKVDRIAWLKQQSPDRQASVIGHHKAWMLREGYLKENQINTPWRVLKAKLERAGISIPANDANLIKRTYDNSSAHAKWHDLSFKNNNFLDGAINRHDSAFKGITHNNKGAYYSPSQKIINISKGMTNGVKRSSAGTWRHEYGHFLDNIIAEKQRLPVFFRSAMSDFSSPMLSEIKQLRERAGFGRKSKKQARILNNNADAIRKITTEMASLNANDRIAVLDDLSSRFNMTREEVITGLSADTMIDISTLEGEIKATQFLTAADRGDIYNMFLIIRQSTFSERNKMYDKGLIGKFSDLIGSASKNKLAGHSSWGLGGHKTSYYESIADQSTEVFANYTALHGAKEQFWYNLMKKLMPETTQKFKDIIDNE